MLYKLLLLATLSLTAETILFEDFDSSPWDLTDWINVSVDQKATYHYSGAFSAQLGAAGDYLTTPALIHPAQLTLYAYQTSASPSLYVEVSSDGIVFNAANNSPFNLPPSSFHKITVDLDPSITHIKFRKNGAGTFYLDNIKVTNSNSYVCSITESINQQITHYSTDQLVYAISCSNNSSETLPLDSLVLKAEGTFHKDELTILPFKIYKSDDEFLSTDDALLCQRAQCSTGQKTEFKLSTEINPQSIAFLLLTIDLSAQTYSTTPKHTISFTPDHSTGIFSNLNPSQEITINQIFSIKDQFTDGNLSINPTWSDPDESFHISMPLEVGEGSIGYFNYTILSTKVNAGHEVCALESTLAYGSWEFLIGEGQDWDTSSRNSYSVVLMSDQIEIEKLKTPSADFNGYYIVNENTFKLIRQDGGNKIELIDTNFPEGGDSSNENDGYSFKISRNSSGYWKIFIDEGDVEPTTLRGQVSDNTWDKSSSFCVRTSIEDPHAKRTIYFDNLNLKSIILPTLDLAKQVHLYYETIDGEKYIKWVESNNKSSNFQLYYLKDDQWEQSNGDLVAEQNIYALNITGIVADDWKLVVTTTSGQNQTVLITAQNSNTLFNYELEQGWNLVGPSGCPKFTDSLPRKSKRWGWDQNSYRLKSTHKLASGLWVKADQAEQILFLDTPENCTTMLNLGWNLVSFSTSFTYNINELVLFYYKDQKYHILEGQVEPFRAYWVFRSL